MLWMTSNPLNVVQPLHSCHAWWVLLAPCHWSADQPVPRAMLLLLSLLPTGLCSMPVCHTCLSTGPCPGRPDAAHSVSLVACAHPQQS